MTRLEKNITQRWIKWTSYLFWRVSRSSFISKIVARWKHNFTTVFTWKLNVVIGSMNGVEGMECRGLYASLWSGWELLDRIPLLVGELKVERNCT